jgi:hypothetical protein
VVQGSRQIRFFELCTVLVRFPEEEDTIYPSSQRVASATDLW